MKNTATTSTIILNFLIVATLYTVVSNIDADIYVPSFPTILDEFQTTAEKVQFILSSNFIGLCIASIFYGPLSDRYGRQIPLLAGLSLFFIGSLGAYLANSLEQVIIFRFIDGLGSAVFATVGAAIMFDLYDMRQAVKFSSILGGISTACVAAAPLLGGWINHNFGWKYNFLFITILAGLTLLAAIFLFKETLPQAKRLRKLEFKTIMRDYYKFATHLPYMANSLICALSYAAIMVYLSNLSLIFIDYLGVDEKTFVYYQASTTLSMVVASLATAALITKIGSKRTTNIGIKLIIIGSILLIIVACFYSYSPNLISITTAILLGGIALSVSIFGARSMTFFPQLKGTASAIGTCMRLLITSIMIFISGLLFNGTIMVVALIICIINLVSVVLYYAVIVPAEKQGI